MTKGFTKEMKERVIHGYKSNKHPSEIAGMFNCHRTTVDRIIKKFNEDGRVDSKQRGHRRKLLHSEHQEAIRIWISENCSITLKAIKDKLLDNFNIVVGTTCIHNTLQSFSYSLKRVSLIPIKRNDTTALEVRYQYAREFYLLLSVEDGTNIYFVDEVGVNISMRSRRGRAPVGKPAVHIVPGLRTKNISICCAMSKQGVLHYKKQTRAFNKATFVDFLNEIFQFFREMGVTDRIIVLDNVPFHKSTEVKQLIADEGHSVRYLPPYSPFLNPIENLFSQWKQLIRSENVRNEEELFSTIDNTWKTISKTHCTNYYLHMLNILPRCLAKEEIHDE